MDKSYIIRVYVQENKSVMGVVEDIQQNKRFRFGSADELWTLVTVSEPEHATTNLIKLDALNTTDETPSSRTNKAC